MGRNAGCTGVSFRYLKNSFLDILFIESIWIFLKISSRSMKMFCKIFILSPSKLNNRYNSCSLPVARFQPLIKLIKIELKKSSTKVWDYTIVKIVSILHSWTRNPHWFSLWTHKIVLFPSKMGILIFSKFSLITEKNSFLVDKIVGKWIFLF